MIKYYAKTECQKIADMYGLGKIHKISHLHLGYGGSSKVAVSTSLGKHIISKNFLSDKKSITSKSKESLQYEIDMLNTIKGMPVPNYVISSRGKYIEKFGKEWVTVYGFLEGKPPEKITPRMAFRLGAFLGEFHKRSRKFQKKLDSRRKFYDLNPDIIKIMEPYANRQKNPILKSIVEKIKKGVEDNRPSEKLPAGPIHVDIGHNNELFIGEKLTGIIDFGNFYIGPLMIDVGKTIMWNCCPNSKFDKKLFKNFIKGYVSQRKLNKSEHAYLKKSILYAIYSHIWVDLYHVPIKYVPESWTLFIVKSFLPVAEEIERSIQY